MGQPALKRLAFVSGGGTYSSVGLHRLDSEYAESGVRDLSGAEVLKRVPEAQDIASVDVYDFEIERDDVSTDIVWLDLRQFILQLWKSGTYDGIVLGHGTNVLEELAYFLHLTLPRDANVVIYGAMRASNALSTDADISLVNAIQVAVAAANQGRGVLVAMNQEIHESASVTKVWTNRVDAFVSLYRGPIGLVQPHDGIRWLSPARQSGGQTCNVDGATRLPRVELVLSHAGADDAMISCVAQSGAAGLVSAGPGSGRPTIMEERAMQRAAADGVVICQASRVPGGYVARTERLRQLGFVASGWLPPWKARILLSLALLRTSIVPEIQEIFVREETR